MNRVTMKVDTLVSDHESFVYLNEVNDTNPARYTVLILHKGRYTQIFCTDVLDAENVKLQLQGQIPMRLLENKEVLITIAPLVVDNAD